MNVSTIYNGNKKIVVREINIAYPYYSNNDRVYLTISKSFAEQANDSYKRHEQQSSS